MQALSTAGFLALTRGLPPVYVGGVLNANGLAHDVHSRTRIIASHADLPAWPMTVAGSGAEQACHHRGLLARDPALIVGQDPQNLATSSEKRRPAPPFLWRKTSSGDTKQ